MKKVDLFNLKYLNYFIIILIFFIQITLYMKVEDTFLDIYFISLVIALFGIHSNKKFFPDQKYGYYMLYFQLIIMKVFLSVSDIENLNIWITVTDFFFLASKFMLIYNIKPRETMKKHIILLYILIYWVLIVSNAKHAVICFSIIISIVFLNRYIKFHTYKIWYVFYILGIIGSHLFLWIIQYHMFLGVLSVLSLPFVHYCFQIKRRIFIPSKNDFRFYSSILSIIIGYLFLSITNTTRELTFLFTIMFSILIYFSHSLIIVLENVEISQYFDEIKEKTIEKNQIKQHINISNIKEDIVKLIDNYIENHFVMDSYQLVLRENYAVTKILTNNLFLSNQIIENQSKVEVWYTHHSFPPIECIQYKDDNWSIQLFYTDTLHTESEKRNMHRQLEYFGKIIINIRSLILRNESYYYDSLSSYERMHVVTVSKMDKQSDDYIKYLHDEILQSILSVQNLLSNTPRVDYISDLIDIEIAKLIYSIRNRVNEFAPSTLFNLTLIENINVLFEKIRLQFETIEFKLIQSDVLDQIPTPLSKIVYRIIKELNWNVGKHSIASKSSTEINIVHNKLEIIVKDNGKGFDYEDLDIYPDETLHIGLLSIKNDVNLLGGSFVIESKTQNKMGSKIIITIPLKR